MDPNAPLGAPPNGVTPNFVNPESRAKEIIVIVTICLVLMVPFFLMRIYSRAFVTRSLGWDDYTCGIGVIGAIAFGCIFVDMTHYGNGTHGWDLTFGRFVGGLKDLLIYTIIYAPTIFFIKLSILILYLRVFSPNRWVRILIYLGMGYIFLTNAITTILFGALCAPRNGQPFIVQYSSRQCVDNADNLALATSIINLVGDLYLLSLPLPLVWKLQLAPKRKFGLITIFLTGILACVSSLASIIVRALWAHNPDYTYWSPVLVYTTNIEMNVGIICACMPACAAVFRRPSPASSTIRSWFSKSPKESPSKQSIVRRQETSITFSERAGLQPYQESHVELAEVAVHPHTGFDTRTH